MAKRGRPTPTMPKVEWKCYIPADIAAKIDLLHLDPIRGTVTYGARSELVTRLLREYLLTVTRPQLDNLPENGEDTLSPHI